MNRARKVGVLTPTIYLVDLQERKIVMEYLGLHAMTVKDFIK
jgi:tRNA A-37 threonylcarbamoyl transferase component Bud32